MILALVPRLLFVYALVHMHRKYVLHASSIPGALQTTFPYEYYPEIGFRVRFSASLTNMSL